MLLRPAFGFANFGATFVCAQVDEAGYRSVTLASQGAQAGDFAIWLNGTPPGPNAWTDLRGRHSTIVGRRLAASDLTATATQQGSYKWGAAVYRDVTDAIARAETGFARSPAHVGVLGFSTSGRVPPVATPAGTVTRFAFANQQTSLSLADLVAPGDPYSDGTAWTPDPGYWDVIELMRS